MISIHAIGSSGIGRRNWAVKKIDLPDLHAVREHKNGLTHQNKQSCNP
jgi:hypothetical protein